MAASFSLNICRRIPRLNAILLLAEGARLQRTAASEGKGQKTQRKEEKKGAKAQS
jgi:hypothetical protein